MNNLAGAKNADTYIRTELTHCRIPVVSVPISGGEVPYTLEGVLGDDVFLLREGFLHKHQGVALDHLHC